jgi:hypothetical protein
MQRDFFIYHSTEYIDDIPTLALFEMNELYKSRLINFTVTLRISKDVVDFP